MRALVLCLAACTPKPFVPDAPRYDMAIQNIVEDELQHVIDDWRPEVAFAIVLKESDIVAVAGWEQGKTDANIPLSRPYVTGSTLKPFTIGVALDTGKLRPTDVFDCRARAYSDGELHDAEKHEDMLSASDILVTSSNVGASRIVDLIGADALVAGLRKFHFGTAPAPFPDPIIPGYQEGLFAAGELYAATPLQVARAYEALFRDGYYEGTDGSGEALTRESAKLVQDMLREAVRAGTGEKAKVKHHKVIGKTGTAVILDKIYASFVGELRDGPPETILVGIYGARDATGPTAAAPVFSRIATRIAKLEHRREQEDD